MAALQELVPRLPGHGRETRFPGQDLTDVLVAREDYDALRTLAADASSPVRWMAAEQLVMHLRGRGDAERLQELADSHFPGPANALASVR